MPDYEVNPNRKAFATIGVVRGTPTISTTSKGGEYVRFNLSVDSNMPLFTVTTFKDAAVKEAKTFAEKDVVLVGGFVEPNEYNGKTYYRITANGCVNMDKLYGMSGVASVADAAPASGNAWTDIKDDDLPFG